MLKAMKMHILILAIVTLCSVSVFGQTQSSNPKAPDEWEMYLNTGGAPWEKQFQVRLDQSGQLTVIEQDPRRSSGPATKTFPVKISEGEAQEIYGLTLEALRKFHFAERHYEAFDGTNLVIGLRIYDTTLEGSFFHLMYVEEAGSEIARIVSLINKHLPKEHLVY
ncbi:MAG TPA: hypothetical protein VF708_12055 [Pyrinomonadaceae bacterium]